MPIFERTGIIANSGAVESHFSDLVFDTAVYGPRNGKELETLDDCHGSGIDHVLLGSSRDGKSERTGNGAMKVNCDYERTLK